MTLLESAQNAAQGVKQFVTDNKTAVLGTAAGAVAVGAVAGLAIASSGRKKRSKRSYKQDRARRSKQPWEVAYQKRKRAKKRKAKKSKRRSHRRGIRYTKNGQPYIILKSGKARFVKGRRRKR